MKIFFEQIKFDGNPLETSFEFQLDDISFSINNFKGKLYPIKKGYILEGDLNITITEKCDRCLKVFDESFSEKVTVEIVRTKPAEESEEQELEDEDMGYYYIKEDFIDLHEILYQEALLVRPLKRICSNACKGLCPVCGKDLNIEQCSCTKDTDSRWEALTKLLQNNK